MPPGIGILDSLAARQYSEIVRQFRNNKPPRRLSSPRVVRFSVPGASLGLAAANADDLIRQLEHGFSYKTLQVFASTTGIATSVIASILGIPERTLARRKAASKLAPDESERLLRVSTVFEKAVELFEGDVMAAVKWLTTSKKALDNQTPLAYCRTELGAREVENLIGRLEHGVFS